MTLELLVCTIDNGIHNVKNVILAPKEGVSYLVSWQHSDNYTPVDIPSELIRDDIKIETLQGRGLSRNRNNAIRHASADICLIADDDCTYRPEYFDSIISTFQKHVELDVATFKMQQCQGKKAYPTQSFDLKKFPKGYYVSSIEIAFRRTSVQGELWFNEHFGLGAPMLQACEDSIFILDAVKYGLKGKFFPVEIVEHNHPTTSTSGVARKEVIMAEGAYIGMAYTWTCVPRLILKAHRLNKANHCGFFSNIKHLIAGIRYYHKKNEG